MGRELATDLGLAAQPERPSNGSFAWPTGLSSSATGSRIVEACERLLLRRSNGVVEASDFLSDKHDWVQLTDEVTEALPRILYVPGSCYLAPRANIFGNAGR